MRNYASVTNIGKRERSVSGTLAFLLIESSNCQAQLDTEIKGLDGKAS